MTFFTWGFFCLLGILAKKIDSTYRSAFTKETAIEMMIDEVKYFDMEIFLAFMKDVYRKEGDRERN